MGILHKRVNFPATVTLQLMLHTVRLTQCDALCEQNTGMTLNVREPQKDQN